jgi:acetoin utilization protein AcuB
MSVGTIMNPHPTTVSPQDTMSDAIRLLKERGFRHLPVVDGEKHVLGVVTDRDLKRVSPSDATTLEVHELLYLLDRVKVADVMTKPPITIDPTTPIKVAAAMLASGRLGCLPVVADGKLVGIVTQTDFLNYLAHSA